MEQADAFGKTSSGKRIYAWRKETIERSFAEAKELHGLRYARMLGRRNMYEQSFLTAAVQNMKRIARAFRSLFSVLPYAFRGCFQKKAALFVGGLMFFKMKTDMLVDKTADFIKTPLFRRVSGQKEKPQTVMA